MSDFRTLRELAALDYLKDVQKKWNELNAEERHASVEMARYVIEDAEKDALKDRIWHDKSLEPELGTIIKCDSCSHKRRTSEEHPTLVNCEKCGSYNVRYKE